MKKPGRNTTLQNRMRAIVARAKPACHLCGLAIDFQLKNPDPMSFVIDHVVPLAKGGADTIENVRAAHRSCNSKKRARLIAPIVRRSGSLDQ